MPTLKEKLMAAKAEGAIRLASVRNYSGVEEAAPLKEERVAAAKEKKTVKPKNAKPKTEKKVTAKSKK
jgi:hypothetical protein